MSLTSPLCLIRSRSLGLALALARLPVVRYSTITKLELERENQKVSVQFDGKEKHTYHAVWLKHLCHCNKCRDVSTGQVKHPPDNIRGSYTLSSVLNQEDSLAVTWKDDDDSDHKGLFSADWLKENAYGKDLVDKLSKEARPVPPEGPPSEFDWGVVSSDLSKRLDFLLKIYEDGFSLLKNVPTKVEYYRVLADFIYDLRSCYYGDFFDVKAEDDSIRKDAASTAVSLAPHNDEPYFESAPGLTLLHCLDFDACVTGGQTMVTDQFAAAEEFRKKYPEEFQVLTTVPAVFGRITNKLTKPTYALYRRPHITLGYNDEIVSISFNNAMQYSVTGTEEMIEAYYPARYAWYQFIKNFKTTAFRLQPGDCLVLNNRRIGHSRTEFKLNGGKRHLIGCYVPIDEFKSEVLAQCTLQGRTRPKNRLGNSDHIV